jgi:hypothetical protein
VNLTALTGGLSVASPMVIGADPGDYRSHFTHQAERMWPETNCYFDLWIEVLHCLRKDPVPAFACLLSADHDGFQWDFVKQPPEDLRRLYGLEVTEENVWLPVLDMVESGPDRGVLHTVEVDSWWLPDTAGTAYRTQHVKTTIVPTRVDRRQRIMWYLHNAGLFELRDDDFDGVFGLSNGHEIVLPPYVEQIRNFPTRIESDAIVSIVREHIQRRPAGNPVGRLAEGVQRATKWLPEAGMETFHLWAFATLRQCGATAELSGDLVEYLDPVFPGSGEAREHFRNVAAGAKSVQFKMARAASGRTVDVAPALEAMAVSWQSGVDIVARAVD